MKDMKKPFMLVLTIYFLCFLFRFIECFFIRTDSTMIGEAILHKLVGIAIMFFFIRLCSLSFFDVGLKDKAYIKKTISGLVFGLIVFALAYSIEIIILACQGNFKTLSLYVTTYAIDKNIGNQTGLIFFIICIVGNIVNVIMEEGIFRGLFQKILENKYSFLTSAVISSALFGLWHIIAPLRGYFDGTISLGGMTANIAMLVTTSALVGFKYALLTKLTGSLYMAMGDHFFNNTIVNLLHTVSLSGADQLMFVRISTAQTVSFIAVLVYYFKKQKIKQKSA